MITRYALFEGQVHPGMTEAYRAAVLALHDKIAQPLGLDATKVAHDVREGYVSRAAAQQLYGVVLDEQGQVDVAATAALRASQPL